MSQKSAQCIYLAFYNYLPYITYPVSISSRVRPWSGVFHNGSSPHCFSLLPPLISTVHPSSSLFDRPRSASAVRELANCFIIYQCCYRLLIICTHPQYALWIQSLVILSLSERASITPNNRNYICLS